MYNGNTTLSQVVQKLHATYYYKSIYSLDQRFPIFFPQIFPLIGYTFPSGTLVC